MPEATLDIVGSRDDVRGGIIKSKSMQNDVRTLQRTRDFKTPLGSDADARNLYRELALLRKSGRQQSTEALKNLQTPKQELAKKFEKREEKSLRHTLTESIVKTVANAFAVAVTYAVWEPYIRLAILKLQSNPADEVVAAALFVVGAFGWLLGQHSGQKDKHCENEKKIN